MYEKWEKLGQSLINMTYYVTVILEQIRTSNPFFDPIRRASLAHGKPVMHLIFSQI